MRIQRVNVLVGFVIAFVAMFFVGLNVYAVCTDEQQFELREKARNVRSTIDYRQGTRMNEDWLDPLTGGPVEMVYIEFDITTYNIVDGLFILMINTTTGQRTTIIPGMTNNGVFVYTTDNWLDVVNYEFRIYTFDIEECRHIRFRTYTVRKPMFNFYSSSTICEGHEEVPYCAKFLNAPFPFPDAEENLVFAIERYLRGESPNYPPSEEENAGIFNINYITITIVLIVIVVISLGTFYVIKKRRTI